MNETNENERAAAATTARKYNNEEKIKFAPPLW